MIFTTNDRVYGKQYGSGYCYLCTMCGAYVGTHKPRPREALGILANARMRKGKIMCHDIFDQMWKGKPHSHEKRAAAYRWLAKEMQIPIEECHFGYFNIEQLRQAYKILISKPQKE